MKTLITSLLLLVSEVISAQVDQTKKPLVNEYAVSTPAKDSLFILDCEVGCRMREIWQKDPEDRGYCPIIVLVSDLTPIKQRFKKPLVNEYAVSTPAKDSLFILDCEAGNKMREIWQKDPEDNGYCPIIVLVSDLTPIKQRFNYNSSKNKRKKS